MESRAFIESQVEKLRLSLERHNALCSHESERIFHSPLDVARISHFENFPYDYQCFAREIGYVNLSWNGYMNLEVLRLPLRLRDLSQFSEIDEEPTYLQSELELSGYIGERAGKAANLCSISDWAAQQGIDDYVLVAENPCSYTYLAFDTEARPFSPVEIFSGHSFNSFLEYVEKDFSYSLKS